MNKPHLFKVEDWTPEEAGLLDEMKDRCLNKGQYIDEKAKDKFKMLCHLEDYALQYYEQQKEIERLKNGYCELKVKCNNGECDCTNEEYDGMVEGNMKLSLEVDRLNNIINETIKDIEHSTLLLEEERVKLKDTPFGKRILYKLKKLKNK